MDTPRHTGEALAQRFNRLCTKAFTRRHWGLSLALGALANVQAKSPPADAARGDRTMGQDRVQLALPWPASGAGLDFGSTQGFLVSEKFDGVRAVWDGQTLRFRSGRALAAPDWFVRALPRTPLDGELWLARGQFDRLSGTVRRQVPDDAAWREVQYLLFDLPEFEAGLGQTFAQRASRLQALAAESACPWLKAVEQSPVPDVLALAERLRRVVGQGGEGLVLHRADALWQSGRSGAVFKLKPEPDEEGRVLAHLPGEGRFKGQTGALLVEGPGGVRFALGTGLTAAQRRKPPALGAWVTYRYQSLTPSGLPRFARFLRVREAE